MFEFGKKGKIYDKNPLFKLVKKFNITSGISNVVMKTY